MKLNQRIFSALLACLILVTGITVFADKAQNKYGEVIEIRREAIRCYYDRGSGMDSEDKSKNHREYIKEAVNSLVAEGKLSKDKATKVLQYIENIENSKKITTKGEVKELEKEKKHGSLRQMVAENIITAEEAEMIVAKFKELKEKRLHDSLEGLIKGGTFTAKEAEAVKNYFISFRKQKAEKLKELENLSPEQRRAFFKEYRKEKQSIFDNMIKDGIITKTQAEELKKALFAQ